MLINETSIALVGLWALREIYSQWKNSSALARVDLERMNGLFQTMRERQIVTDLALEHLAKDVDAAHAKIREAELERKGIQAQK